MTPFGPMPVVVVAGLHADARRETVGQLLREVSGSIALHHDLSAGPAGTVRRSVRDAGGETSFGDTPWSTTAPAARCARTWSPNWCGWPRTA